MGINNRFNRRLLSLGQAHTDKIVILKCENYNNSNKKNLPTTTMVK